jgi:hypothetical protein
MEPTIAGRMMLTRQVLKKFQSLSELVSETGQLTILLGKI